MTQRAIVPYRPPSLVARARAALKAWQWGQAGRPGAGTATVLDFGSPRTAIDFGAEVGDIRQHAIIMACIHWLMQTFPEAPVRVGARDGDGKLVANHRHPLARLLAQPNDFMSGTLLWQHTVAEWNLYGNAFWLKWRNAHGQVVNLWPESALTIRPRYAGDGLVPAVVPVPTLDGTPAWIEYYEVWRGISAALPTGWKRMERTDVVHFRFGLDVQRRLGLPKLAPALHEIFTDQEAALYSALVLRNSGVPPLLVSPEPGSMIDDPEHVKRMLLLKTQGDARGEPLVLQDPVKVQLLAFNPQTLNLRDLRRIPEERITALLNLNAMVVGLGAGLDRSTFANYGEAREAAYEGNLIPTFRHFAETLHGQLLTPDFGGTDGDAVEWDLSGIRVLQQDQDALWARVTMAWVQDLLTRAQALAELGKQPAPDERDAVYRSAWLATVKPTIVRTPGAPALPAPAGDTVPLPPATPGADGTLPADVGAELEPAAPATNGKG